MTAITPRRATARAGADELREAADQYRRHAYNLAYTVSRLTELTAYLAGCGSTVPPTAIADITQARAALANLPDLPATGPHGQRPQRKAAKPA